MQKSIYLLLLAVAVCCKPATESPDLIIYHAKVWTADSTFAEAVAIRGNRITAVGPNAVIQALAGTSTQQLDANGQLVLPGFNDAHIHFLGGSLGLSRADLNDAKGPSDVIDRVLLYARANPTKPWIQGRGWQYTNFEGGLPDSRQLAPLDTIARPVYLVAYDGHSAWANKAALQLAGVNEKTVFNGFGSVVRDKKNQPTGALLEGAKGLVGQLIPDPTRQDQLDAIRLGLKKAASLGITSVHNANGDAEELSLYEELLAKGELTIRYRMSFSVDKDATDTHLDTLAMLRDRIGTSHPMLRADAIKFMIDGVIESHTAAMLEPYSDVQHGEKGDLAIPSDRYRALVKALDARKFQLTVHAIGDGAVREALDAYELAAKENPAFDRRHRIEHIESVSPQDIPRFSTLGVWASMQPIHADPGTSAVWSAAAGPERTRYGFAWRSLLNAGASLVYGSDWPACINVDPMHGLHIAVNRRTPQGHPEGGYVKEQTITIGEALHAYTAMGAVSSGEGDLKGRIAPGYLADVVVVSRDLFTIDPMEIAGTQVTLTIFDGKVIYKR